MLSARQPTYRVPKNSLASTDLGAGARARTDQRVEGRSAATLALRLKLDENPAFGDHLVLIESGAASVGNF